MYFEFVEEFSAILNFAKSRAAAPAVARTEECVLQGERSMRTAAPVDDPDGQRTHSRKGAMISLALAEASESTASGCTLHAPSAAPLAIQASRPPAPGSRNAINCYGITHLDRVADGSPGGTRTCPLPRESNRPETMAVAGPRRGPQGGSVSAPRSRTASDLPAEVQFNGASPGDAPFFLPARLAAAGGGYCC